MHAYKMNVKVSICFFMLQLASCELLNQESNTSTIAAAVQQCSDAVLQNTGLNLYNSIALGNSTYSLQIVGQMCMAAALRHNLNTDNDVSHGIFDKTTPNNLYSFIKGIKNMMHSGEYVTVDANYGYEIKDLSLQSSRMAIYDSTIKGPQQGSLSAIIYYFDTICSNSDLSTCSQNQQVYCDVNSLNNDNITFARYTNGTLKSGCWLQYQKTPVYNPGVTNNFVQSGFPLFGTFNSTNSPAQLLLAKQLTHNTVHTNADAVFTIDNTTHESLGLKYGDYIGLANLTTRMRSKTGQQHEQCPLDLIAYTESIQNMTNGQFPFIVENDNEGICILARNENLIAGSPNSPTNNESILAVPIGSTSLTGFCRKDSTLVVRGPPLWNSVIPLKTLGFSLSSDPRIFVDSQLCPALVKSAITINDSSLDGGTDGICQQTYCSEIMFNPGTGFTSTISAQSTVDSNWPRGQGDIPENGSIDGVLCGPTLDMLKFIVTSITNCSKNGYNVGLSDDVATCSLDLPTNAEDALFSITESPYLYGTRGVAIDTYTPSNQSGPGTEATIYFPQNSITSISNNAIAYNQQIGYISDYRSCLKDTALIDYANDIFNSKSSNEGGTENDINSQEVNSLTQSILDSTSITNTTNTVIGMNKCMNDLLNEATLDPTAATPITAANTAGGSVFALIAVVVAAVAKEYEQKVGPAIKNNFILGNRMHNIAVTLIVSAILIISVVVGMLPVIVTLVQEITLAHKVRISSYISPGEIIFIASQYVNIPIQTSFVMQCHLTLPPPHYRLIVTTMGVILGLWLIIMAYILWTLFRKCCR